MARSEVEHDIEIQGPLLRETLINADPLLTPDDPDLQKLIPAYGDWHLHRRGYRIWTTMMGLAGIVGDSFQYDRVVAKASGLSAGGKDALREEMERQAPGFTGRVVTATSRPPKPGEVHGVDYYFYDDRDALLQAVAHGDFVEHVLQGDRAYGLPKRSFDDALAGSVPFIVTHVEMASGWPAAHDYLTQEYQGSPPREFDIFLLPEMRAQAYFNEWLPGHRPAGEVESRANRAAWEIFHAPVQAEVIVTNVMSSNRPTLKQEASDLMSMMELVLKDDVPRPTGLARLPDLGVGYIPRLRHAQDVVLDSGH